MNTKFLQHLLLILMLSMVAVLRQEYTHIILRIVHGILQPVILGGLSKEPQP